MLPGKGFEKQWIKGEATCNHGYSYSPLQSLLRMKFGGILLHFEKTLRNLRLSKRSGGCLVPFRTDRMKCRWKSCMKEWMWIKSL